MHPELQLIALRFWIILVEILILPPPQPDCYQIFMRENPLEIEFLVARCIQNSGGETIFRLIEILEIFLVTQVNLLETPHSIIKETEKKSIHSPVVEGLLSLIVDFSYQCVNYIVLLKHPMMQRRETMLTQMQK